MQGKQPFDKTRKRTKGARKKPTVGFGEMAQRIKSLLSKYDGLVFGYRGHM